MPELKKMVLSPEEVEKETVLSCMIERQHTEPNAKNLESLFGALKGSMVYVPAKLLINPADQAKVNQAVKEGHGGKFSAAVKFAPMLMVNNQTNEKLMPIFSREAEYYDEKNKDKLPTFVRMPIDKLIEFADNMPEAFDIIFDCQTHGVRLTLDQLEIGLGMAEAYDDDEEASEGEEETV